MELIRNMKNLDETINYEDVILFINEKSKEKLLDFRMFIKGIDAPSIFYIYFEENTIKYIGKSIDNDYCSLCDSFISFEKFEIFLKIYKSYSLLWFNQMSIIGKIIFES